MKTLLLSILGLFSSISLALPDAKLVNEKSLELLLEKSSQIKIDGDIHAHETLDSILAGARKSNAKFENLCEYTSYDNMYECTLFLNFIIDGVYFGETAVIYQVKADESQMPLRLLSLSAEIARGH